MTAKPQPKRIPQLDGLRAVAVTAVFLFHAFHIKLLWMGVDLFFILSGFFITGILLDRKHQGPRAYFGRFYARRAKRILPPYLLLLIAGSIAFGLASWDTHWYFYLFLMNLALALHVDMPKAFQVLWSLAVEEQFYLLWPFFVLFASDELIGWAAASLLLLVPLLRYLYSPFLHSNWSVYALTPFRMDCLAAGALVALLARKKPAWLDFAGKIGPLLSLAALGGLLFLGLHLHLSTYANSPIGNTWIYVCTLWTCFGLFLWALRGKGFGISFLQCKPVTYIGRISYSIYLFHLLFLMLLARFLNVRWQVAALAAVLTISYASLSWFWMETPILQAKPISLFKNLHKKETQKVP
jgi:peptidoglycan/LPS O-acetylase OafA/YrhL